MESKGEEHKDEAVDLNKVISDSLTSLSYLLADHGRDDISLNCDVPNRQDEHEDTNLERTIGNVLNDFYQSSSVKSELIKNGQHHESENFKEPELEDFEEIESHLGPNNLDEADERQVNESDLDLEAAIKSAFGDSIRSEIERGEHDGDDGNAPSCLDEEMDLNVVIGNAFNDVLKKENQISSISSVHVSDVGSKNKVPESSAARKDKPKMKSEIQHSNNSENEQLNELEHQKGKQERNLPNVGTNLLEIEGEDKIIQGHQLIEEQDIELERAIGDAFNAIVGTSHETNYLEDNLEDSKSRTIRVALEKVKDFKNEELSSNRRIGPSDFAKQVAERISESNSIIRQDGPKISKEILLTLIAEITNQVEEELLGNHSTEKSNPSESNLRNDEHSDCRTEEAVTVSSKHVSEKNNYASTSLEHAGSSVSPGIINHEAEFEESQMNDILQNAFNMAMENPQGLLTNMEIEHEDSKASYELHEEDEEASNNSTTTLIRQLPSSIASFLSSLQRSKDIDLSFNEKNSPIDDLEQEYDSKASTHNLEKDDLSKTDDESLSIAETLALHRSSMSAPRKNYSSIRTLEELLKSDPWNTDGTKIGLELSKVLSTISNKIHSDQTGSEKNVLQVIRKMTNILTKKQSSQRFSLSPEEIMFNYENEGGKETIVSALCHTKKFLRQQRIQSQYIPQSLILIDKVLNMLGEKDQNENSSYITENYEDVANEHIISISNTIMSTISNFFTLRGGFSAILGSGQPKLDSLEYREKIRQINRARKKRWRVVNAERNKDNDLRSRVLKRAALIFGENDSSEKNLWVEEEYNIRKGRRMAKEKKEEEEKFQAGSDAERQRFIQDKEIESFSKDPKLVNPLSDIFNIITGTFKSENVLATLLAIACSSAAVASHFAKLKNTDFKLVDSATVTIISSLLEEINSAGDIDRIARLSRGVPPRFKINDHPFYTSTSKTQTFEESSLQVRQDRNEILSRLSTTFRDISLDSPDITRLDNWENMNSRSKRVINDLSNNYKRLKSSDLEQSYIQKAVSGSHPDLKPNFAFTRSPRSIPSTLKMPSYKPPDSKISAANPIFNTRSSKTTETRLSPFISHKIGGIDILKKPAPDNNISSPSTRNLKKPARFQRPTYKKFPTRKSFASSQMHSTQ
ncbi:uncharacterized protein PRCAT00001661001 [Priceomyces carsonii]|uniref:uncharacterized protein n=1 Tax=Priceomyces carsonii TaxID=28549 RepID=UPI002EDB360B|nr:unnamed protein product [Priceomyces carsonii]